MRFFQLGGYQFVNKRRFVCTGSSV